jgi:broad specificity phosphatase PhoE
MPPAFVRLFLVRHAEALANPDLRYLGSRDDPLTEHGQWQAAQLAQTFASLRLAAVYTSPLTRAVETAIPMAHRHHLSPIPDPRLAEAAMGTWEGLRRIDVLGRSPEDAAHHQRWETDPTCAPPGGESFADVQARVVACVHELAERHAGALVVVVSHVGPIKALLCAVLDVPLTAARRMFLDGATVSVIDWGADAVDWGVPAVLRLYNAHHYLAWEAAPWMAQSFNTAIRDDRAAAQHRREVQSSHR